MEETFAIDVSAMQNQHHRRADYKCAACHRQESATAGTVFHRTRTDLTKWFLAAYLMGRDKRGVSAKFL